MGMEYADNPKGRAVIKKTLEDIFGIEKLEEKDIKNFLFLLEQGTNEKYKNIPDYSGSCIDYYFLGGERLEKLKIYFSPNHFFVQMNEVINKKGYDSFIRKGKYKKLREMIVASYLALALKKISQKEYSIAIGESPDVTIASLADRSWKEKPLELMQAEILEIMPHERENWNSVLDDKVISFAIDKKGNMRYGKKEEVGLIIGIRLNRKENLELKDSLIKSAVKNSEIKNIYGFIVVIIYFNVGASKFTVHWIHPAGKNDKLNVSVELHKEITLLNPYKTIIKNGYEEENDITYG